MPVDEIYKKRLEKKLKPDVVVTNLVRAAVLITAFELLKVEVVNKLRDFLGVEYGPTGWLPSSRWKAEVLALDEQKKKSPFRASSLWLAKNEVIRPDDVDVLLAIRDHRNRVAHELPAFLIDPESRPDDRLLQEALRLTTIVGKFWARMAVDCNPEFDSQEVSDSELFLMSSALMSLVLGSITKIALRHDT
jgi:hypothetical protein